MRTPDPRGWTDIRPARAWSRLRVRATYWAVYGLLGSFVVAGTFATGVAVAPPAQAAETLRTFIHYAGSTPNDRNVFIRGLDGASSPRGHDSYFTPFASAYGTPTLMRVRMMGGRGGYGGRDGSAGRTSPGNVGYVETVWFSPRDVQVYPGGAGGWGADYRSCGGGGGPGYSHSAWDGGWGGGAGCRGSSGGGGGGGAASAVIINGGWLVAGGGGGAGGNGNFSSQSWMAGYNYGSAHNSFTGGNGGNLACCSVDGGGGGGGGGGWNASVGGSWIWVSWAGEYGGQGGFVGYNGNATGLGLAASDWRWNSNGEGWVAIDVYYASVPSAPTSLRVTSVGDQQAAIAWNVPSDNGGLAVSTYEICVGTTTSANNRCVQTSSLSATFTELTSGTRLVNGTTYYFKVRAYNSAGWGSYSGVVSAVPRTVPSPPGSLTVTEGIGRLDLSWPEPNNGGSAITDYLIQYQIGSSGTWQTWNDGVSTNRTFAFSPLTNGQLYGVRVFAGNAAGWSATPVTSSGTPYTAPSSPTGVQVSLVDSRTLNVTWNAPTSNGGKAVAQYWLEQATGTTLTGGPTTAWTGVSTRPATTSLRVGGLTTGTIYYFRVRADNGQLSPWSTAASGRVATVPGTPSGLQVAPFKCTDGSQNQDCSGAVQVSWPATTDGGAPITVYRVQYAPMAFETSTPSWITATPRVETTTDKGAPTVTADIYGLTNGVSYTFRVSAINVVGQGPWSTQTAFSTTLVPRTVPGVPTGVVVTGSGDRYVDLAWTAPSSDGGRPIIDYRIQYETSTNGTNWSPWAMYETRSVSTTTRVVGLQNGVTYRFRVAAGNDSGVGPNSRPAPLVGALSASPSTSSAFGSPSTSSSAVVPLDVPDKPAISLNAGSESFTVTATLTDNGGTAVTGWQYTLNGGAWRAAETFTVSGTTYTFVIPNLTNGTTYAVVARAVNSVGTGVSSDAASTFPYTVPDAPTNLRVTSLGNAQVAIAWSAPANNGGESVDSFTVSYRDVTGNGSWVDAGTTLSSRTINGLTNGRTYEFRVLATNARGASAWSDTITAIPRTLPGAPQSVTISSVGNETLTVTWAAPSSDGGNALTGYLLEYATNSSFSSAVSVPVSASATSRTLSGLTNGTTYWVRVTAVNAAGSSLPSGFASGYPRTVPTAPQAVLAVAESHSVVASWQAPTSNGGDTITAYTVQVVDTTDAVVGTFTTNATTFSHTFTGLTPKAQYFVRVVATNSAGSGSSARSSGTVTVFGQATAPAAPTATQGNGQAIVRFDAANVDANGSPVTGYRVTTWDETGTTQISNIAACTTSTPLADSPTVFECIVTGLTNKVSYTFKVQSLNAAGAGALSTQSSVVKPGSSPQSITAPAVVGPIRAGDRAIAIDAKASSGLPVSYAIAAGSANICSLVGPTDADKKAWGLVSPDRAGTCVVVVTQDGANSAFAAATPIEVTFTVWPSAPSAARITSAQATGTGQITVTWSAPVNVGGTAVVKYEVTARSVLTPSDSKTVATTDTATLSQVITGLAAGQYTVIVTAYNDTPTVGSNTPGLSSVSAPETVTAFVQPDSPTISSVATGDRSLVVTWTAPGNTGGIPLTGYTAAAFTAAGAFAGQCVAGESAKSCTITGLANDVTYDVRVTASHAYLTSESSTAVTQTAGELAQTVTITGDTTTVAWSSGLTRTLPASSSAGIPVTYSVTTSSVCSVDSSGKVSLNRAGTCTIVATAAGIGNAYATASDTETIEVTPVAPGEPVITVFRASSASGSVRLTWTAPATDGGVLIDSYTVTLSSNGTNVKTDSRTAAGSIDYSDLAPGNYTVSVVAHNVAGTSTADTATVSLVVAPSAPETVTATTGDQALTVSWQAPSFTGGESLTGYRVSAAPVVGSPGSPVSGSCSTTGATTCVVTGLTQDVTYSITVVASNSRFTSAASTAITAATGQLPQAIAWVSSSGAAVNMASYVLGTGAISFNEGTVVLVAQSREGNGDGTARTGAAITYGTSTSAVCSVDAASGLVTPLKAGSCVITADQNGSGNAYAAAVQETFTLTINQVQPVAPVRVSWTFTPQTAASAGVAASETGTVTVTYQVPNAVALGGGETYTLSALIGGATASCSGSTCSATYVFPSGATVATVSVVDTITVGDVATDVVTGPWTASASGNITLTLFRPDPSAPESVTATSSNSGTQVTATWRPPSYTGKNNADTITAYVVTLEGPNGIIRQPGLRVDAYAYETPTVPTSPTSGTTFIGSSMVSNINGSWGSGIVGASGRSDNVILVYSGWFTPAHTGTTNLYVKANDGVRVYLNGALVADKWQTRSSTGEFAWNSQTTAGVPMSLRLEYLAHDGDAEILFGSRIDTSTIFTAIPADSFTTDSRAIPATNGQDTAGETTTYNEIFNASPSTQYVVKVQAKNSTFTSNPAGAVVTTPSKPSVPTNLRATANANSSITLTWETPTTNGGQAVSAYRVTSDNGATWASVGSALTYTTGTLTPGTPYTFIVQAQNAVGFSDSATIAVTAIAATSAPETVTATTEGQDTGTIAVSWSVPETTNGAAITGYKVEVLSGGTVVATKITGTETATTFTGLARGNYTVRVSAENAAGYSNAKTSAGVTVSRTQTIAVRVNGQTVTESATYAVTSDSVTVTTLASGGSAVTAAITSADPKHCFLVDGELGFARNLGATSRSCVLTLTTAADSVYEAAIETITITVTAVLPGAPASVTATPGNGTIAVAWTAPSYDGGAPVDSYTVTVETSTGVVDSITVDAAQLTHTFSGLTNGTGYTVRVRADNNVAGTAPATSRTGVIPRTTPDTPTITTVTNLGVGQVQVTWTAPFNGGVAIDSYTVSVLADTSTSAQALASCTVGGATTTCTIGGLKRGDGYDVSVVAANAAGSSPVGRLSEGASPATLSVGQPQTVTFDNGAGSAITSLLTRYGAAAQRLFGTSSSGAPVTFAVTDYDTTTLASGSAVPCVVSNGLLTVGNFLLKAGETQTTCVITASVAADDVYVAALETITVTVNAVGPDAPDPVQLIPGNEQITVIWTVHEHPRLGGAPLTGFILEYTRIFDETGTPQFESRTPSTRYGRIYIGDPADDSHTVTGLLNGYPYAVRVLATNAAGEGEWDPIATPTGAPLPVRGVTDGESPTVTALDRAIKVQWRAPIDDTATIDGFTETYFGDGGSPIAGYTVTIWNSTGTYVCTVQPNADTSTVLFCTVPVPTNKVAYNVSVAVANERESTTTNLGTATPIATQVITLSAPSTGLNADTATTRSGSFVYGSTVQLNGSSSSGLAVTYASTTPNVCGVSSAGLVTASKVDTCTIEVSQAGDAVFNPADTVTVTLTVDVNLVNDTPTVSAIKTNGATFSAAIPWAGADVTVQFEACRQSTCESTTAVTVGSTSTGAVTGSLTTLLPDETYTVRTVISAGGSTSTSDAATFFTLKTPLITTETPSLTALTPISVTLEADTATGTGTFSSWVVSSGTLPSGLTLDTSTAVLSGTPTGSNDQLETQTVTIRVTDSGGNVGERQYTLVVQGASPNLSIADITDRQYSPTPLPTSVSAVDLTRVSYASDSSDFCTINESGTITMLKAGECSLTVTSAAHGVYAAASVVETFTVAEADQVITFPQPAGRTYATGETFTIAATASSNLPVTFSTTSPACSLSGTNNTVVTIQGAGNCVVTASQVPTGGDEDRYNVAPQESRTIVIAQAAPTITLTSMPKVAFGETETVTATVSGNGAVTVTLLGGQTPVASETASISTSGGNSYITAHKADTQITLRISAASTNNYTAGSIDVIFDLVRAGQTITIPNQSPIWPDDVSVLNVGETVTVTTGATGTVGSITYAPNRVVDLLATASSGDTVTYVSTNPLVAEVETNTVKVKGAGTTTIKLDQGGTFGTYLPAAQREVVLTVNRAPQDFTVPGWQETATYGDADIAINASNVVPGRTVGLLSTTLGTCEITDDAKVRIVGVETCTVVASNPGGANYLPHSETYTMYVYRATRTVTITTTPPFNETRTVHVTYLNEDIELTYGASDEDDSVKTLTLTGPCVLSSDSRTITTTGAGTCVLTVSVDQGINFGPATSTVEIVVAKAPQRITNVIKGTNPKIVGTPQLPEDVLSWTIETISVSAGDSVVVGQEVARLLGVKGDGTTVLETVTVSDTGVVSTIRDLTAEGADTDLGEGIMLVTVEVTRQPTGLERISTPALPESATSWAVTQTTAVGQILDIGEIAATIRAQEDIKTGELAGGATSWRATSVSSVGATITDTTTAVATVVPQARIALPALVDGTSAWVVKSTVTGDVTANATVGSISGVRVVVTPTLPVGATSWSIVETPTTAAGTSSTAVALLVARDANGDVLGETVTVAAGVAGTVVSYSETTTGLGSGAPILTIHSTPVALTTPMAGTVTTPAVVGTSLLDAGTVVAVVSGTAVELKANRTGTVTWVNDDLNVLSAGEAVLKIQGETVTLRATAPGTVNLSTAAGTDGVPGATAIISLDTPRADSRNQAIKTPSLPTTAPETATYTVAWSAASGSAVLIGDTLTILTVNAPDMEIKTPGLPQATDKNPAGASFIVESTTAVGTFVPVGGVAIVVRAVEANGTPFPDTIDVLATVAGTVTSVNIAAGTTGVNELTTVLTMSYDSITVVSPEPGRVLTSITPGTGNLAANATVAYVEKTLRFGERQLISASKGPGTAPLVFASVDANGTPSTSICEIVPNFLGGTGVQANSVGTCYITINQAGDANYLAAPTETVTISIDRAEQEVAIELADGLRFGDDPIIPVVRAAEGASITLVSSNETIFIVESGTVVPTGVGSATLEVIAGSTDLFNETREPARQTIVVSQGIQVVSVLAPVSGTVGERYTLVGTTRSNLTVTFTSTTPSVCTVTGTTLDLTNSGTCVINANQEGDPYWLPAETVTRSIVVNPRPQSGGDGGAASPTLSVDIPTDGGSTTVDLSKIPGFESATITIENLLPSQQAMVSVANRILRVQPPASFSGRIEFTLVGSTPERTQRIPVVVRVASVNPTNITFQPLTATTSRVSWTAAPNAVSYVVTVNGEPSCLTPETSCVVRTVLGPDSVVTVQSVGRDGVVASLSAPGAFRATPGQVLTQATLLRSSITTTSKKQIRTLATSLADAGYERIRLVVAAGPTEKRSVVRAKAGKVAALFKKTADIAATTSIVKATPAQVRKATRAGTVPSATITIRLVVPVTGPRLPSPNSTP